MDRTPQSTTDPGRKGQRHEESGSLRSQAETITQDVSEEAEDLARDIAETGREAAESYMHIAARRLAGLARAVDAAASELREQHQEEFADRAHEIASGLDRFSTQLDRNDFDSVMTDAKEWARDNPTAFLGGSVAVGLAVSRFLSASSERHRGEYEETRLGEFEDEGEDERRRIGAATAPMPSNDFETMTMRPAPRPAEAVPSAPITSGRNQSEE